jgi:predicted DsbA family dithiol-disulfide isomerase
LPKLYKFYKKDCPPCYSLERILLQIEIPKQIELINSNIAIDENKNLAKENGIDKVPSLLFENGNKLVGLKSKEEIIEFIGQNI